MKTQPLSTGSPKRSFLLFAFLILISVLGVNFLIYQAELQTYKYEEQGNVSKAAAQAEQKFQLALISAESISAFFESSQNVESSEFDIFAAALAARAKRGGLNVTLEWVDVDNVIRYVYPMNDLNQRAVGLDMNRYANRLNAIEKAKNTRASVVTSPVMLVQGYPGLLIFNPIYKGEKYLGTALTVVRVADLLALAESVEYVKMDNFILPAAKEVIYTTGGKRVTDSQGTLVADPSAEMYANRETDLVENITFADKVWELRYSPQYASLVMQREQVYLGISGMFLVVFLYLVYLTYKNQQQLAREKARFETLFTSIGDAVIACDERSIVTYANPHALRMAQSDERDFVGKNYGEVLKVVRDEGEIVDIKDRPYYRALQTGKTFEASIHDHFNILRKDGTKLPITVTDSPIVVNGKVVGVIIVLRDSSKEKEIDLMKTEFISFASHQLKTPLTVVNWNLEMLLSGDFGVLSQNQKEALETAHTSGMEMNELIAGFLDVSKIESGGFVLDPGESNFAEVFDNAVTDLSHVIKEKRIEIEKSYEGDAPHAHFGPKTAKVIAQNLLTNAVKYTPAGGNVRIRLKKEGDKLSIAVTDTGYGIPDTAKAKIFSKLFRADNVVKKEFGTGLGLYLVKAIVEKAGGKIWFESRENIGTTFFVELPKLA